MSTIPFTHVSDTEFAFGFPTLPTPPPGSIPPNQDWIEVAGYLVEHGLGRRPQLEPRPQLGIREALRFLGALLSAPGVDDHLEQVATWLRRMFVVIQPEGGPKAAEV